MRSLDRFVLIVVLQSLEEERGRLFYRVEQPTGAGSSCERPDLVFVASSNPFEIAGSVRQVGDAGVLHCGADLDRILRLVLLDCFHRREGQHDSQARVEAQPRLVRAHGAVANVDFWSVQLRDVLHVLCTLHCADISDDVHDGVR